MDQIKKLLEKVDTLPASPALLPKLAQTLSDVRHTDVYEIVDIIVYDSALTAKLLQIANSAYFGSPMPLSDVGEAVGRLGYDIVFRLAAAISGANCLKPAPGTGLDAAALWRHSVITAFGAQYVAQSSKTDPNLAFTAGLLHDLGKVVLAGTYGKDYSSMLEPLKRGSGPLVDWETETYGCNHAEVGAALLEKWKLPAPLVSAVKYHHHAPNAGENKSLAACVCLGNAMAHAFEDQTLALDANNPEIEPALKIVGLNVNDLRTQWNLIQEKWEFVQALCELQK
jgi:putative nucleotidyltransferase with HDIG domain